MCVDPKQVKNDISIYLSASAHRIEETRNAVLLYPKQMVINELTLPEDAEERFRVYDLCIKLGSGCEHILDNVYKECNDDSDPISQLAALEFVKEHKMVPDDTFIDLFNKHRDDPMLLPSIAQAIIKHLLSDIQKYEEMLQFIIDKATTDMPDLLGVLPEIARDKHGANMLIKSQNYIFFADETQYSPELRTMNYYIRTLLIGSLDDPSPVILTPKKILTSLSNPTPGLRVACLEHVAAAAPFAKEEFMNYDGFRARMCDVTMDTTVEEQKSRLKAQDALGISIRKSGGNAATELRKEPEFELMVI